MTDPIKTYFAPMAWVDGAWAKDVTLVIDGQYLVTPSGGYDVFFRNVDQLIELARKNRGGK